MDKGYGFMECRDRSESSERPSTVKSEQEAGRSQATSGTIFGDAKHVDDKVKLKASGGKNYISLSCQIGYRHHSPGSQK